MKITYNGYGERAGEGTRVAAGTPEELSAKMRQVLGSKSKGLLGYGGGEPDASLTPKLAAAKVGDQIPYGMVHRANLEPSGYTRVHIDIEVREV